MAATNMCSNFDGLRCRSPGGLYFRYLYSQQTRLVKRLRGSYTSDVFIASRLGLRLRGSYTSDVFIASRVGL